MKFIYETPYGKYQVKINGNYHGTFQTVEEAQKVVAEHLAKEDKLSISEKEYNAIIAQVIRNTRQKCSNPKIKTYASWGSQGYRVCRQWDTSDPTAFIEWAKKNGYQKGYGLRIKDGCKVFNPRNCYLGFHPKSNSKYRDDKKSYTVIEETRETPVKMKVFDRSRYLTALGSHKAFARTA